MDPSQIDKLIRRSPGSLLSTALPQATRLDLLDLLLWPRRSTCQQPSYGSSPTVKSSAWCRASWMFIFISSQSLLIVSILLFFGLPLHRWPWTRPCRAIFGYQAAYSNKNKNTLSSYTSFNTVSPSQFWLVAVFVRRRFGHDNLSPFWSRRFGVPPFWPYPGQKTERF